MKEISVFNYINSIIYDKILIEASAGTGKTNVISLLYIRFLLNINLDKYFDNLLIDNILIVTFTELACLEIKNRILNNIRNLKISCLYNKCIDNSIYDLFIYIKNFPNIVNILTKLEYKIDFFSIFTIHGFCKKIIFSNFIEFNIDYKLKIISNEIDLIYELVIFYWYNKLSILPINIVKIILSYWSNYNLLFNDIKKFLNIYNINFNFNYFKYKNINECYLNIINYINIFKKEWLINEKFLFNYLLNLKIKYFSLFKLKFFFYNINLWCKEKTINFNLIKYLLKFSYNNLKSSYVNIFIDKNFLFLYIDFLFLKIRDLYNYILLDCLNFINLNLKNKKFSKSLISFDDLIFILNDFINNKDNVFFLNILRKNYPIILIDEFQDTDYIQFNIFKKIYINNNTKYKTKIILIGDPKQSIYSFRGADIFNYIKIKRLINHFYTLIFNWRSSYFLNKGINYLFSKIKDPFIFRDIFYIKVNSLNKKFYILKENKIDFSIKFFLFNNLNCFNFKYKLANYCALKIINILNNNKYYILDKDNIKRNIIISDIAILVYSNLDVKLILEVFNKYNLPILYDHLNNNIFNTLQAKEIYYILKAILFPLNKKYLKNALLTSIFNFNIFSINKYFNNLKLMNNIVEKFYIYYNLWNKNGIFFLIKFILKEKFNNLNYFNDKNKILINYINLSEILHIKYLKINDKYLLVMWLFDKINNLCNLKDDYKIKNYFNSFDYINIITIHKSKGLQYNIVWLPFLFKLRRNNKFYCFYDRNSFIFNVDFYKFRFNKNLMLEELYSEEMRLFYVALTRSVYQCNIFIYNLFNNNKKFNNFYINKILNINNNFINFFYLKKYLLNNFNNKYISIKYIDIIKYKRNIKFLFNFDFFKDYKNIKFNNFINRKRIINYSNFKKNILNLYKSNKLNINNNLILPRGKNIGNFFHNILENIDFKKKLNINYILFKLNEFNIDKKFFFLIKNILFNLLNVKLKFINLSLVSNYINIYDKEFNFFLYLSKKINISFLNSILKKYDLVSRNSFRLINKGNCLYGYLNGIIDLIFINNNKYYIVDYKSNYIGNDFYDYNNINMFKFMCINRYDIQYLFYTIALHKFLKFNIFNYSYKNNFGGIYYIFLRGLLLDSNNKSFTGIYFIKPKFKLINILSKFFNKKSIFYEK